MAAFAKRFKCPLIQISTMDAIAFSYHSMGNPSHPIVNSDFLWGFPKKLNFFQRLISTIAVLPVQYICTFHIIPSEQLLVNKHFGNKFLNVHEVPSNTSMFFVNTNPILHPIRALLPNIIQIGGGIHLMPSKPLAKDLKDRLDSATNRFIYFSLGSSIKSKLLSANVQKIFLETFPELPYRHPNIRLLITQGGLQSLEEAIYSYVPIFGMPFIGDQHHNIQMMMDKGVGLSINANKIDKDSLKEIIIEVINNPRYRNKVKELAELAQDQPRTGLERGVWWTHSGLFVFRDMSDMKNVIFSILFGFVVFVTPTFSARILGIASVPSFSHQIVYRPIWRELSLRGHNLTVLTTDPMRDPTLTNLTEIDMSISYKTWNEANFNEISKLGFFKMMNKFMSLSYDLMEEQLLLPEVQKLLKSETEHFDLIMLEFSPSLSAFSQRFDCPLIVMTSLDALTSVYYALGNPAHPVLNPDLWLGLPDKLNFFQRLASSLYVVSMNCLFEYYMAPAYDALIKKHFGSNYSLKDSLERISMLFVNTDTVFHPLRPLLPNIIQIGGGTHFTLAKPLPKDLQQQLDKAKDGFIYFSLGSNIKSERLSEATRTILLETFSELPYLVLWKFEEENLPGKPDNVIISKWFPQQDIFRHPNIKLFITQGGLQSCEEAIYNHIPMVGIPFIGDQKSNVQKLVNKGMALLVSHETMDKAILKAAILEVLNNPLYRNRVKELAELAQDQPMTGLERAIWWTEYVLRHKGAEHLRSPALDIPSYQYFLLDVIGFCLLVVLIFSYVLYKLVKLVFKIIRYFVPKSKIKVQ
ncbi:hypothetical protein ILUMI_06155 [Ignelater luminosus]|uniref:UDP-glycosyltransferases domain-containing protein n=1 Tax=Ignelater luminosus TaxID=2038154 RepID=A0A8K0GCV3_IGNLU|nr:hypothetical protein ILUMI_06155 [Ignelater luminosus]